MKEAAKKGRTPKNNKTRDAGKGKGRSAPRRYNPRTEEEFKQTIKVETSQIKNKEKRLEVRQKRKAMLKSIKAKARRQRANLPAEERQKPVTIEDKQPATEGHLIESHPEHEVDEFNKILNNEQGVKLMITTSLKPPTRLYNFVKELMILFPKVFYYPRQDFKLDEIYGFAKNMNYSHVLIVRDAGEKNQWELMIRKIDGCLAVFKISNITLAKDIFHHGNATDHKPELILNNFNSKLGIKVGRLLSSMFPQEPEFKGRRVVTFHNQRDFIFVRHHRYIFKDEFSRVAMQEIGPRFTLRLRNLYESGVEGKVGDLEFSAKDDMYVERTKIYL